MTKSTDSRIEDDPNASMRTLQYVADQLEAQIRERDAESARELAEMMLRDRIRRLRLELPRG